MILEVTFTIIIFLWYSPQSNDTTCYSSGVPCGWSPTLPDNIRIVWKCLKVYKCLLRHGIYFAVKKFYCTGPAPPWSLVFDRLSQRENLERQRNEFCFFEQKMKFLQIESTLVIYLFVAGNSKIFLFCPGCGVNLGSFWFWFSFSLTLPLSHSGSSKNELFCFGTVFSENTKWNNANYKSVERLKEYQQAW
jgi:hypothetical protein